MFPGKAGLVTRPNYVKVKALNEDMEEIVAGGRQSLLARAFCHEIDHLDGTAVCGPCGRRTFHGCGKREETKRMRRRV